MSRTSWSCGVSSQYTSQRSPAANSAATTSATFGALPAAPRAIRVRLLDFSQEIARGRTPDAGQNNPGWPHRIRKRPDFPSPGEAPSDDENRGLEVAYLLSDRCVPLR